MASALMHMHMATRPSEGGTALPGGGPHVQHHHDDRMEQPYAQVPAHQRDQREGRAAGGEVTRRRQKPPLKHQLLARPHNTDTLCRAIALQNVEEAETLVGGTCFPDYVNTVNSKGQPPLLVAVRRCPSLIAFLVAHGASLDHVDESQSFTLLHHAAYANSMQSATLLATMAPHQLFAKAREVYRSPDGTPANVAEMYGHAEVAKFLRLQMAKNQAYVAQMPARGIPNTAAAGAGMRTAMGTVSTADSTVLVAPEFVLPKTVTMDRRRRLLNWATDVDVDLADPYAAAASQEREAAADRAEDTYLAGVHMLQQAQQKQQEQQNGGGGGGVGAPGGGQDVPRGAVNDHNTRTPEPLEAAIRDGDVSQAIAVLSSRGSSRGTDAPVTRLPHSQCTGAGTALHLAAALGRTKIVELLLWGVACRGHGLDGIVGEKKEVRAALASRTDCGYTAMVLAASNGHTETVALLLRRGADIEAKTLDKQTALMVASYRGYAPTVALLLDHGASVKPRNEHGCTAMTLACYTGSVTTAALCLDSGADIEARHVNGSTPLLLAAQNGHADTVAWLLRRGADIRRKSNKGHTALTLAARNGHTSTAVLLLDKGADLARGTSKGCTALMAAARHGHEDVCRMLIGRLRAASIGLDTPDCSGWTALHYAAYSGQVVVAALLLEKGSDPSVECAKGDVALDVADLKGHGDTAVLLHAAMLAQNKLKHQHQHQHQHPSVPSGLKRASSLKRPPSLKGRSASLQKKTVSFKVRPPCAASGSDEERARPSLSPSPSSLSSSSKSSAELALEAESPYRTSPVVSPVPASAPALASGAGAGLVQPQVSSGSPGTRSSRVDANHGAGAAGGAVYTNPRPRDRDSSSEGAYELGWNPMHAANRGGQQGQGEGHYELGWNPKQLVETAEAEQTDAVPAGGVSKAPASGPPPDYSKPTCV